MKKISIFLLVIFVTITSANAGNEKLDADLKILNISLKNKNITFPLSKSILFNAKVVDVFIKSTDIEVVKTEILNNSGKVLGVYGRSILSARIPHSVVEVLSNMPEVLKIETSKIVTSTNAKAKQHIGADKAHSGQSPLPKPFTGKGVLVGIIDTGIDFFHKDFFKRDDSTTSRIIAIFDTELDSPNPPFNLPFGKAFTREEIQSTIKGTSTVALETKDVDGHGTHVAGSAAGLSGIAPDAEIIAVRSLNRIDDDNVYATLSTEILVSMEFIEEIVKLEKKPLVYNMSLGIMEGIRDGNDLASQALDELLSRNPQTVCVVAAGNSGDEYIHWGGNLPVLGESIVYLTAFGIGGDNVNIGNFTLRIPNSDTNSCTIHLRPISITNELNFLELLGLLPIDNFKVNSEKYDTTFKISLKQLLVTPQIIRNFRLITRGNTDCTFELNCIRRDDAVELSITLKDSFLESNLFSYMNFDIFQFALEGSPNAHLWKDEGFGSFIELPTSKGLPSLQGLREPDKFMNLGTFPTLSKNCIVVGAYSNMDSFIDKTGSISSFENLEIPEGELAPFSSKGPTADGRVKPDITAPGHNVISARSQYADFSDSDIQFGDTTFVASSGTSMSSPIVCGAIALLFEQKPGLEVEEIRELLKTTAITDGFTGAVPNEGWGWGKINIFAALQRLIVSVDGNNDISKSINVYPSVTSDKIVISMDDAGSKNEIFVVTTLGETMFTTSVDNQQLQNYILPVKSFPTGQYYVVIKNEKGWKSQTFTVIR